MPTALTRHLEIGYADAGPADGPVALLLHGGPDGAQTWEAVAARLNAAGLRSISPA